MGLFSSGGGSALFGTAILIFVIGAWAVMEYRGRERRHTMAMHELQSHKAPEARPRTNWVRVATTSLVFMVLLGVSKFALDFKAGGGELFRNPLILLKYSVFTEFVAIALLLLAMVVRDVKILTNR